MSFHFNLLLAVPIWHRSRLGLGDPASFCSASPTIPSSRSPAAWTSSPFWLAARHHEPWPYYALMATIGAVIGGYITYALARKGGKEAMDRKLSRKRAKQVSKVFERLGIFSPVAIPALLPPPFPFVPFLIAAGAGQYSPKKFLAASPWTRHPLLHRRLPRYPLRSPYPAFLQPVLQTRRRDPGRPRRHRRHPLANPIPADEEKIGN